MKALGISLFALILSGHAMANSNFITNPYLPYPPGCGLVPEMDAQGRLEAPAVNVYDGIIETLDVRNSEWVPIQFRAYRSPCSEPDRSLLWLTLTLDANHASETAELLLPSIGVQLSGQASNTWINLATETNGWGSGAEFDRQATYLTASQRGQLYYYDPLSANGKRRWMFVLDSFPPLSEWWPWAGVLTASKYNDRFTLTVRSGQASKEITIDVPATSELLPAPAPRLPISGRLSGNWVIAGAADQGVTLSISGKIPPDRSYAPDGDELTMVVFLAHYTFDASGHMLWLTGAAEIAQGAYEVTIPIERVINGDFRGSRSADREIVGSVTIASNSCNDLAFNYDYSALGLGSGEKRLSRLFSMETAGHDCRDYEARVAANR